MRYSIIIGKVGAGKTTAILSMARNLIHEKGLKVGIMYDELGDIPLNNSVADENGFKLSDRGSPCPCLSCNLGALVNSIKELEEDIHPDVVLLEAGDAIVATRLKEFAQTAMEFVDISFGPAFVFVDCSRIDKYVLGPLWLRTGNHVKEADIVILNKVEGVPEEKLQAAEKKILDLNPEVEVIRLGKDDPEMLERMITTLLNQKEYHKVTV